MKLKSTLIFTLVVFYFISMASAQRLSFGLKVGADVHKLSGQSFSNRFTFGYHFGGFAAIKIINKWGLQPELYYSQTNVDSGSSFRQVYQFNNISKIKLGYLNIPILLNYYPVPLVALQAGPQFSILTDKNKGLLTNGKEALKSGNVSLVAGFQISLRKLRVYGRYVRGLSNINDIDDVQKWRNQTIHLGLGLAF